MTAPLPWPDDHSTVAFVVHVAEFFSASGAPDVAVRLSQLAEELDPRGARDMAIRAAIAIWPELKLTPACQRLSDELDRYVTSSAWLERERHIAILPQDVTEPRRRLLHRIARLSGGDGSLGARQIFNLMKSNPLSIS